MSHCKTCKHWTSFRKAYPSSGCTERFHGGICMSPKLMEATYDDDNYAPDTLVYPYQEDGDFWTGPEFGCVHHEEV